MDDDEDDDEEMGMDGKKGKSQSDVDTYQFNFMALKQILLAKEVILNILILLERSY